MKTKICVFCGKKPHNKNKEHIIPQWLMKLTDTYQKEMSVGSNWSTGHEQVFNFSNFTFPSCTDCNTSYGIKEARIKPIIEKVLKDYHVSKKEIIELLDWFDKIRIGLHLAVMYMNKQTFNFDPKYCIESRVGLKDRLLAITNTYDNSKTLRWTGVNSYLFMFSPTTFTLKINNVLFTNCSSDFIVSKQLGFPFLEFFRPKIEDSNEVDIFIKKGKHKITNPLFKSKLYEPSIIISQPIYSVGKSKLKEYYDNEYVRNNSISYEKGIGEIFITEHGETSTLNDNESISSISDTPNKKKKFKFNKPTTLFQFEVFNFIPYNLSNLSEEQKRVHNQFRRFMIENAKLQLKKYDY